MSGIEPNHGKGKLMGAVRRRQWERHVWATRGERSVWRNLAMFGSLGWLIVIPTLIGLVAGRWLDGSLGTGITMTAAGIFVGVCLGGLLAWQRMNRE